MQHGNDGMMKPIFNTRFDTNSVILPTPWRNAIHHRDNLPLPKLPHLLSR